MGQSGQNKRRRPWIVIGVIVAIVAVRLTILAPRNPDIIIGHDTTRIDGPVRADGTVDYVAWMNKHYSRGVTKDNNAAVLLLRAVGPDSLGKELRDKAFPMERFLKLLDMPPVPENSRFFIRFKDFAKAREPDKPLEDDDKKAVDWSEHLDPLLQTPWSAQDKPIVAAWLEEISEPLELAVAASRRTHFYLPLVAREGEDSVWGTLSIHPPISFCYVYHALVVRAMKRFHDKDVDGAWQDALAGLRLARMSAKHPRLSWNMLMDATARLCVEATSSFAIHGNLTSNQARKYIADIRSLGNFPDIVECLDTMERFWGLGTFMLLKQQWDHTPTSSDSANTHSMEDRLPLCLDWNRALRIVNRHYDRLVAASKKPRLQRKEELAQINQDISFEYGTDKFRFSAILVMIFGSPFQGTYSDDMSDAIMSMGTPSVGRLMAAHDVTIMKLELVKLALALAACKADKGEFPTSLDELRGKYIPEIPLDIFSGKPLVYRRVDKGYLLYSVGDDMKDDGGKDSGGEPDITVRME